MMPSLEHSVRESCRALGWMGEVVGPVQFGGIRFWASAVINRREHARRLAAGLTAVTDRERLVGELEVPDNQRRLQPPLALEGCLVSSDRPASALRDASLLAGYCCRAVLVPDSGDVLGLCADAALLDQGVLVWGRDGITRLADAGPRVATAGCLLAREWELLERVYDAYLASSLRLTG